MTLKHRLRLVISGTLPDKSDLVGSSPRFLYVGTAIGLALMLLLAYPRP